MWKDKNRYRKNTLKRITQYSLKGYRTNFALFYMFYRTIKMHRESVMLPRCIIFCVVLPNAHSRYEARMVVLL